MQMIAPAPNEQLSPFAVELRANRPPQAKSASGEFSEVFSDVRRRAHSTEHEPNSVSVGEDNHASLEAVPEKLDPAASVELDVEVDADGFDPKQEAERSEADVTTHESPPEVEHAAKQSKKVGVDRNDQPPAQPVALVREPNAQFLRPAAIKSNIEMPVQRFQSTQIDANEDAFPHIVVSQAKSTNQRASRSTTRIDPATAQASPFLPTRETVQFQPAQHEARVGEGESNESFSQVPPRGIGTGLPHTSRTQHVRPLEAPFLPHQPADTGPAPTQNQTNGNKAALEMSDRHEQAPAVARAAHIDMTVRLENATAQTANASDSARQLPAPIPLAVSPSPAQPSTHLANAPFTSGQFFGPAEHATDQARIESTFANQVVRGLSAMMNQRGGVMNMRLDPPELGALRIHMTIVRGNVTAEFQAASQQAHSLLEKGMATLRTALEGQGLTVDRLSVHVAHATGNSSGAQFWRDDANHAGHSHQHRSSHDAAQGESRGRGDQQPNHQRPHYQRANFEDLFHTSAPPTMND